MRSETICQVLLLDTQRKSDPKVRRGLKILIILSLDVEVGLRMITYRANFRSLLANHDMSAVSALPDHVAVFGE